MQNVAGRSFHQRQHICAIYDTPEEQLAVAVAYVADGVHKRERCLYVTDSAAALDGFRRALGATGIDVGDAEATRALLLRTSAQAHLAGGGFDPERMLLLLNELLEETLNDGFTGLRTCGDMSWLLGNPPGSQLVVEYEAVLNAFFDNVRGLGMCQYDRSRLPLTLLDHAGLGKHSTVVLDGRHRENPFFDPEAGPGHRGDAAAFERKLHSLRSAH